MKVSAVKFAIRCLGIFMPIFVFMVFLSADVQADELLPFDTLTAADIRFEISENAFYQEQTDTYIIGPGGYVTFYMTIEERVHGQGNEYGKEHSSTLTPTNEGYMDIEGFLLSSYNYKYFYKKLPADPEREILYQSSGVNLDKLGRLPKFYYVDTQYPKVATVYPRYEDTYQNDVSKGAYIDKIVICIAEDPVLFSSDFEIKYHFLASGYVEETDWTVCNDMNFIYVPEEKRNTEMSLFLEIRDKLGRYYPSNHSWGAKGTNLTCRIIMSSDKVIEGGEMLYYYLMDPSKYELARNSFKALEEIHEEPRSEYQKVIAVFLNSHPTSMMPGYKRSAEDIDIENSGYQWCKNPVTPDYDRPFIPFDRYYKAVDNHSYYNIPVEGYWADISDLGRDITEDGTYYLFVRAQDNVTGGYDWFPVIYNGNEYTYIVGNIDITEHRVKLVKDSTPLEINITEPQFDNADYDIRIEVKDNYKLYAAQYQICDHDACSSTYKGCTDEWIDIELSDDQTTAVKTINTRDIKDRYLNLMENFTVHVRAVEARHAKNDNPFEDDRNIVSKAVRYYVPRAFYDPVIEMGFFGEIEEPGVLKAAGEYKLYFYGKPREIYDEANGWYYEEKNVPGNIYYSFKPEGEEPEWIPLNGNELVLKAEDHIEDYLYDTLSTSGAAVLFSGSTAGTEAAADYILKAKVEDPWNNMESDEIEYKLSFTNQTDENVPIINAELSNYFITNENIDVTLSSSIPVSVKVTDEADASLIYESNDHNAGHVFEITKNGHYIVEYGTQEGYSDKKDLIIANIDRHFSSAFGGTSGRIVYSPQITTKDNVTAHLFVGERTFPKDEGITYYNGWVNYVFENNGSHEFDVQDMAGNNIGEFTNIYPPYEWDITAQVDWIDKNIPDYSIQYSQTGPTNQPVSARIICPGGTVVNNGGSDTHIFYNNGSFTFKVRENSSGLQYEYTAEVNTIDKVAPEITLEGQLVYPLYQGLEFDFVESGYSAWDNLDGDITHKVEISNNVNVYEGGFYEITYTVSDEAGNVTTVSRSVPVYKISNITLLINGMGIRGEAHLNKGDLTFQMAGLRSENFILKYLPGKHRPGSFKSDGIVIENKQLSINEEGWYTFYVLDEEMTMFCGQAYLK